MIILVDVDGVIAQFYQSMLKHVARIAAVKYHDDPELSKVLRYNSVTTYWCYDQMPPEHVTIAREVTSHDAFWRTLPEIPKAKEAINLLAQDHTVIFVTHPTITCPTWTAARYTWLKERFPWITPKSLIVTAAKEHVDGDILIEDSQDNIQEWLRQRRLRHSNRNYKAFTFVAPYNRHAKQQWGWEGILEALKEL